MVGSSGVSKIVISDISFCTVHRFSGGSCGLFGGRGPAFLKKCCVRKTCTLSYKPVLTVSDHF